MRSITVGLAFACGLLAPSESVAQADAKPARPVENVTITGARSRQAIEGFVQSLATPTHASNKVARWEDPICPTTVGLKKQFASFITQRVKEIAGKVGAPVNANDGCAPNIAIVFTTAPQALLENIRRNQAGYLGYYDNSTQLDALAQIKQPIQSWYTTGTKDLEGKVDIDSGKTLGAGLEVYLPCLDQPGGVCLVHLPNAHAASVTGSRLGDGLRAGLYNVIIVADPTKLIDFEMGTLSDYIAMLSLAQVNTSDTCQSLSSIVNLMANDCTSKPLALTDNDLGYLRALYKMSPDRSLQVQRDEMTFQMQQSLGVH